MTSCTTAGSGSVSTSVSRLFAFKPWDSTKSGNLNCADHSPNDGLATTFIRCVTARGRTISRHTLFLLLFLLASGMLTGSGTEQETERLPQGIWVEGFIYDGRSSEPLPAVHVAAGKAPATVLTGNDGYFRIFVEIDADRLEIHRRGYRDQAFYLGGCRRDLMVLLTPID